MDVRGTLGGITLNQTGRELESMLLLMGFYLSVSLFISSIINWYNRSFQIVVRQMKNYAYVRKKSIPPSPPPLIEVGVIGWIRQNLFSSWFNSFLTLFSLYFIFICLLDFVPWAWGGHWTAKSLRECMDLDPNVACFSVLAARWEQGSHGLYR